MTETAKTNTVYLFGAGVTKSINRNAPLNHELLPMILTDLPRGRNQQIVDFLIEVYPSTTKVLNGLNYLELKKDVNKRAKCLETLQKNIPSIEDVLSLLDDALVKNRPLCQQFNRDRIVATRNAVVSCISGILKKQLDDIKKPDDYDQHNQNFNQFFKCLPDNTSIITTNYDMTVDSRLHAATNAVNYGFTPRGELDNNGIHRIDTDRKSYTLLKLHGSLNWVYCPYCNAIDVCYETKIVEEIFKKPPWGCTGFPKDSVGQHAYRPMLIVPTMLKSYDNPVFSAIWDKAEDKLAVADEIVIAGYSLPDADIQLRTRLTRALIRNREHRYKSGTKVKVTIIDRFYKPGSQGKKKARQHFARLLGYEINYEPIGFENYVARCVTDLNSESRMNH